MYDRKKFKDIAYILPFVGFILLLPPFLALSGKDSFVFGVPGLTLYLFVVWLSLIGGAFFVSHGLSRAGSEEAEERD